MSFFPFFLLSNLGFALLGQVLGQRFGNGYEGWMRNNILSRFDMSNTFFNLDDRYTRIIEEKTENKDIENKNNRFIHSGPHLICQTHFSLWMTGTSR